MQADPIEADRLVQNAAAAVDARAFKQGMRAIGSGVTILASEHPKHGCCGLTATAVCSYSAEPPTLLACVNKSSSFADCLADEALFSVNLPAADQEHVAKTFGGMNRAKGQHRFSAGSWLRSEAGVPRLFGARAVFECRAIEVIPRASHLIVIGLITDVKLDRENRDPLFYLGGRFVTAQDC